MDKDYREPHRLQFYEWDEGEVEFIMEDLENKHLLNDYEILSDSKCKYSGWFEFSDLEVTEEYILLLRDQYTFNHNNKTEFIFSSDFDPNNDYPE